MLVSSNIKSDLCNSNCKPDDIHLHRILQEQQLLNPLLFYTMATPTAEELREFYNEETEYTTPQDDFEDTYPDIVEAGNNGDDDDE